MLYKNSIIKLARLYLKVQHVKELYIYIYINSSSLPQFLQLTYAQVPSKQNGPEEKKMACEL
jgi:hypothetical protein